MRPIDTIYITVHTTAVRWRRLSEHPSWLVLVFLNTEAAATGWYRSRLEDHDQLVWSWSAHLLSDHSSELLSCYLSILHTRIQNSCPWVASKQASKAHSKLRSAEGETAPCIRFATTQTKIYYFPQQLQLSIESEVLSQLSKPACAILLLLLLLQVPALSRERRRCRRRRRGKKTSPGRRQGSTVRTHHTHPHTHTRKGTTQQSACCVCCVPSWKDD